MKKKEPFYFPVTSAFIYQIFLIALSSLPLVDFLVFLKGITRIVFVIISIVVILLQMLLFIFSILFWWNVPLRFTNQGIQTKKNRILKVYFWEDIVDVKMVAKWPSSKGHAYVRIVILYRDGTNIRFEPNSLINKEIFKKCPNDSFIKKFNTVIKGE